MSIFTETYKVSHGCAGCVYGKPCKIEGIRAIDVYRNLVTDKLYTVLRDGKCSPYRLFEVEKEHVLNKGRGTRYVE